MISGISTLRRLRREEHVFGATHSRLHHESLSEGREGGRDGERDPGELGESRGHLSITAVMGALTHLDILQLK